jgi:hypothetical protein
MYSQNDLDEAVAAGALSADAAMSLRSFVEQQRALPGVDEEHFRLITGFNDIFVAIAGSILLFAVGWIGQSIGQSLGLVIDFDGPSPLAPVAIAITAWGLALFFTANREKAHGAAVDHSVAGVCWSNLCGNGFRLGARRRRTSGRAGGDLRRHHRLDCRCSRGGCRLAALETLPRSDHGRCRGCSRRRPIRRIRPASPAARTSPSGFICWRRR